MSRTTPRVLGTLGVTAAVALALAGCASTAPETSTGADVESLTFAVPVLPTALDWEGFFEASVITYTVRDNINAGLIRYQYEENPLDENAYVQNYTAYEAVLADPDEPYTISDDGATYTFHLREGVMSQSGNELTAEDVRWSFERKCLAGATPTNCFANLAPYFTSHEQIEVIDDYTVAFHLNNVDSGVWLLQYLAAPHSFIYDKEALLEHATAEDAWAEEWATMNSGWGFGAYNIESITPDQQMVLTANPDYVLGEPEVKTISLQVVANSGTRAQLVQSGNAQIAEALTSEDQQALLGRDNVLVPEVPTPIEFAYLVLVQDKAPFDDPLVREAFRYAVPYDQIIDQVYGGRATTSPGWLNANMQIDGLSEEPAYETDVDRAAALLAEAGLERVPVTMTVSSANPEQVDAAILMASEMSDAGFDIEIEQRSAGDFASGRNDRSYSAFLAANRSQIQVPSYVAKTFFNPGIPSQAQGAFPGSTELDALQAAAVAAGEATSAEARPAWQEVQDFLNTEASALPMVYTQPLQAFSTDLAGITYRFDNSIDLSMLTAR